MLAWSSTKLYKQAFKSIFHAEETSVQQPYEQQQVPQGRTNIEKQTHTHIYIYIYYRLSLRNGIYLLQKPKGSGSLSLNKLPVWIVGRRISDPRSTAIAPAERCPGGGIKWLELSREEAGILPWTGVVLAALFHFCTKRHDPDCLANRGTLVVVIWQALAENNVLVVDGIVLNNGQRAVQTEPLPRFILSTLVAHNVHSLS